MVVPPKAALDAGELDEAIDSVAEYIVRHTGETGRFTYVLKANGKAKNNRYNVLRHGGTLYAMGAYRGLRGSQPDIDAALVRAGRYLVKHHLGTFAPPNGIGGDDSIAVWSRTGEEIRRDRREAKLGGAGLGLVALLAAREVDESVATLEQLRGLAQTIRAMQKPSGHFTSKVIEGGGIDTKFVSLYYPGEAILGLTRLYAIDPDERWLSAAGLAIKALVEKRKTVSDADLPADHWLLIAIGELASLSQTKGDLNSSLPLSIEQMVEHGVRLADAMLRDQRNANAEGGFHPERRSTPTATRLEGLLSLLAVLGAEHPARDRIENAARAGIRFLLSCRVTTAGPREGGITRSCPPGAGGRAGEIRIDYAQHALSAFVGARALRL